MVAALVEPLVNGAITVEWVRSYGLSRVRVPSLGKRLIEHRRYSRHRAGAGYTAVNNQVPALGRHPIGLREDNRGQVPQEKSRRKIG